MRVRVLIAAHMALLVATSGVVVKDKKIWLNKCCDVHQMFSADAESCVEANWPSNFSIKQGNYDDVVPPLDKEWVRRWLPPGLPMENIEEVSYGTIYDRVYLSSPSVVSVIYEFHRREQPSVVSVNASTWWDPALLEEEELLRNTVAFVGRYLIARPRPGGGYRKAEYCVDAAPPPLGPFVMRFRTQCNMEECAYKCCSVGSILINNEGHWQCENNAEGFWTPGNSSLTVFDQEFPYAEYYMYGEIYTFCVKPRLLPFEEKYADWSRHNHGFIFFFFSTWNTCFDFYRSSDSLQEGFFICEHSRITRGVYRLLRPLCFLSSLLLTASLLSVACNKDMRRKIHGRCLACHAASLLAFNIGQIVYYIALSEPFDKGVKYIITEDLQTECKYFSLSMYFVLTASWFWLSALCGNMMRGFRLQVARPNEGSGKKFLVISAFAWGLPAVLTITCSILFTQPKNLETPAWYTPSLMETRTCYIESLSSDSDVVEPNEIVPFTKSGTALFYYGPVFCLVLSNIVCLVVTLRKVLYLKRGNSVLRREEDQIPQGQRHTEGNNPPTAYTATGNEQTPQGRNRKGTAVDAKTIKLYIKMILISGGIELLTEVIMWVTTYENFLMPLEIGYYYSELDRDLAYRAAGYVTDFFRAAVVTWLAAPEGGYMGLIMRRLRRDKKGKKSPAAGNAGRRKQNVA